MPPLIAEVLRLFGRRSDRWVRLAARQRTPRYWRIRNRVARVRFLIARRSFAITSLSKAGGSSLSTAYQILRVIAIAAVFAGLSVIVLALISKYSSENLSRWRVINVAQRFISRRADANAQLSLYSTVAQIAGVFLGLYFTALTVVASTSYRDVPAGIREVVIEERAGNVYLKVVAFTGAAALFCLIALTLGWAPGALNAILVALLSTLSVVSFTKLGLRVFSFFDPTSVAAYLAGQIIDAADASTPKGYRWSDPSFQQYQQRAAARAVTSFSNLIPITSTAANSTDALAAVASRALATLLGYSQLKPQIPADSYWFERVMQHQSWLTASGTSLDMAIRSGAGIQPTPTPDILWLENRLISVAADATQLLLDRAEYEAASGVVEHMLQCLDSLAEQWQFDIALLLNARMGVLSSGLLETLAAREAPERSALYRLNVVDVLVAGPPSIIAALGRAAEKLTPEFVTSLAQRRTERTGKMPLGFATPVGVRTNLQFFGGALDFERDVERNPITPDWFVAHNLARVYCLDLRRSLNRLIDLCESTYGPLARKNWQGMRPEEELLIVQRGREACHKMKVHSEIIASTATRLLSLKRAFGEQSWESVDTEQVEKRADKLDAELLGALARLAPRLSTELPTGKLPDSLGIAFTTLGAEAFTALIERQDELFAQLFQPYLSLALYAHDRARLELDDRGTDVQLMVSLDVLIEIAELSGYAYFVTHSLGGNAWNTVRAIWDKLLAAVPEAKRLVTLTLLADQYRDARLGVLAPREIIRTNWKLRFGSAMSAAGLGGERLASPWDVDGGSLAVPIDPLTHAALRGLSIMGDARDVFFVAYLAKRSEAAGVDAPRGASDLEDEREQVIRWRTEAARDGSGPFGRRAQRGFWHAPESDTSTIDVDVDPGDQTPESTHSEAENKPKQDEK